MAAMKAREKELKDEKEAARQVCGDPSTVSAPGRMIADDGDDAGTDNFAQGKAGKAGREGAVCKVGGEDAREESREAETP